MAAPSIAAGIACLDEMGLDCIIVGRGGGSLEDLWAFNEEETAFAIFHARTPIISAVGHETDFTIADFVADLRAPTPSAAAELAVFDYRSLMSTLEVRQNQLDMAMQTQLDRRLARLEELKRRLNGQDPAHQMALKQERLEILRQRLARSMDVKVKDYRHRIALCAGKLEALSPLKKLSGGFAYVTDCEGKAVQKAAELKAGDPMLLQFADGKVEAAAVRVWPADDGMMVEENR